MHSTEIARQRSLSQRVSKTEFERPEQVVAWFGAMQAQDYRQVKWAVGLRGRDLTEARVEQAIAERSLVRTWLNRGTLHLVKSADVHWMLALLSPRIIAGSARRSRQLELGEATYGRSQVIVAKALASGLQLTRTELMEALERGGISTKDQRGYHILRRAGLDGVVCFGPLRKGQQTFVLLDEWLKPASPMAKVEALTELARRYFRSHGPATVADFIWWSGLTTADARLGLEAIQQSIDHLRVDGADYYGGGAATATGVERPDAAHLLPGYDEYFLGYQERGEILGPGNDKALIARGGVIYPMLLIDGLIMGSWKAEEEGGRTLITLNTFEPMAKLAVKGLAEAADRYSAYLGKPVILSPSTD